MDEIKEEIKKLVVARLEAMPKSIRIFIGDHAKMNKEDLIKHVKKGDPLGKKIVKMHLLYLQSLKKYAK